MPEESTVERILTVTESQEHSIQRLLHWLGLKSDGDSPREFPHYPGISSDGSGAAEAIVPSMDTSQTVGWNYARWYGEGADENANDYTYLYPEKQTLYASAITFLTNFLQNALANSDFPMYGPTANLYYDDWKDITTSSRGTQDADPDLEDVAAVRADWTDWFDEAVRTPAETAFSRYQKPQIEEAFAGTGPRWSSIRARAVQQATEQLSTDLASQHAKWAYEWMSAVAAFKDKMLDRRAGNRASRNQFNATMYDKMIERRFNLWLEWIKRLTQWRTEYHAKLIGLIQDPLKYYIETPAKTLLQRAMVLMQSGELDRGIRGQKKLVRFQDWLRATPLMNPAIEYICAIAGQPLYTAVATPEAPSPWGQVAQGAFNFLGNAFQGIGTSLLGG